MRRQRTAPTTLATQNTFQPGDYVLWNPKETPTSLRSSKLAPKLLGPYSVIRQTANDVECRHLATQKLQTFHTDRLSPFVGTPASAKTMSLLDQDLHLVSAILAHRGNPKPLSKLYFLVAWQNYPSSSNTWEPYSNVKHLSLLHQYLSNNNLSHLIPRLHRQ
jgi:Chromo (CHRromatin Organisation MOdifier) domain